MHCCSLCGRVAEFPVGRMFLCAACLGVWNVIHSDDELTRAMESMSVQ